MSIFAYTGLPGSGKSYGVVGNQILPALKAGRLVVTNIPLNLDVIRELLPEARISDFPTEQVQGSPELIDQYAAPGCVLVLDEVWRLWPAGQKANQVPEPFKKLLAEHRHMVDEAGNSMQIVLVTQDLAQIAAFARQLVETTFHHTKLSHVGAEGSYRVDVYQGPVSGPNPPRQSRIREIFGRYDPAVFKFYKSHTMSRSKESGANEKALDRRANIWQRPMIYVGLAFVVAAVLWGIPHMRKGFTPELAKVAGRQDAAPDGSAARAATRVAGVPEPAWRIGLDIPEIDVTYITDGVSYVVLRGPENCDRSEHVVQCRWRGMVISNEVQRVRSASGGATLPAVQPVSSSASGG